MTSDQKFICLQAIFTLAWVDDFHDEEAAYLRALVDRMKLEPPRHLVAMGWFKQAPNEPNWESICLDPTLGEQILHQAIYLSMLDMTVTARELSFLQRLREKLGLEEMVFYRIQAQVEQSLFANKS